MFAPSIARVARSTSCLSATPTSALRWTTRSNPQAPFRTCHQRRLSSSKPSVPPSNKKKPCRGVEEDAVAQVPGRVAQPMKVMQNSEQNKKQTKKQNGTESNSKIIHPTLVSSARNVPRVEDTAFLTEQEVNMAAFFASHRPLSLAIGGIPPPVSVEGLEKLMLWPPEQIQMVQKVDRSVSGFIQGLEDVLNDSKPDTEAQQRLEVAPTEESIHHYAANLRPFTPPPPPIIFDTSIAGQQPFLAASNATLENNAYAQAHFTEVQLPYEQQDEQPKTFREHVHRRRGGMLLISVKRQRKLKMKKHKYKKLMKRTRLLRRKLDRT